MNASETEVLWSVSLLVVSKHTACFSLCFSSILLTCGFILQIDGLILLISQVREEYQSILCTYLHFT